MLLQVIQCYLHAKQKTWDQDLEEFAATILAMKNRQTQFYANMLVLGRELRRPIDLMLGVEHANMCQNDPAQWVQNLCTALKQVHEVACSNIRTSLQRQKCDYDLHVNLKKYNVGDVVYKINSAIIIGQSKKLQSPWLGPYLVEAVQGIFKIRSQKKSEWIHHDRLKMCEDAQLPLWLHHEHHIALDLDETIAYDDDQDENNLPDEVNYPDEEEMVDFIYDQETAKINAVNRDNTNQAQGILPIQDDQNSIDIDYIKIDDHYDEDVEPISLTDDVPDYDLDSLFEIPESNNVTHTYANLPKDKSWQGYLSPKIFEGPFSVNKRLP